MQKIVRGSRKHILDWVERPTFREEFLELLAFTGVVIKDNDDWMPVSYSKPQEARLERFGPRYLPELLDWQHLADWWLVHKKIANTPNWDLVSTCKVEGKQGLVLVEAKANVPELKRDRKPLDINASEKSRENHIRIGEAIGEARAALDVMFSGVEISRDSHYQLSNRVAFSWKLASMGVPNVLLYLGFMGDTGIKNAGEPFRDDTHWEKVFSSYIEGVLPATFIGAKIECGQATMQMISCSRPVIEPSPPLT